MTTYELFLCWIIIMLLVLVVGEASIIKLGLDVPPTLLSRADEVIE